MSSIVNVSHNQILWLRSKINCKFTIRGSVGFDHSNTIRAYISSLCNSECATSDNLS